MKYIFKGLTISFLTITATLLIIFVITTFGCQQKITCNSPYILVGYHCCLDMNHNSICDSDEKPRIDSCTPDWKCSDWASCTSENIQKRVCWDKNTCGSNQGRPFEEQNCKYEPSIETQISEQPVLVQQVEKPEVQQCQPDWRCSDWSECSSDKIQRRTCNDENACNIAVGKPIELLSCIYEPFKKTPNSLNRLFDVVVIVDTSSNYTITDNDIRRVFDEAKSALYDRTFQTMNLQDIYYTSRNGKSDTEIVEDYANLHEDNPPEGVIIFSQGEQNMAKIFGGYALEASIDPKYCNQFYIDPKMQKGIIYVATVDWAHMYAACGYDINLNHISMTSIKRENVGTECNNQVGIPCVWNVKLKYFMCSDAFDDFYSQPDVFIYASIIHEFMHSFGYYSNGDHYGRKECENISGGGYDINSNRTLFVSNSQQNFEMCRYVYNNFRQALNGCDAVATNVTITSCRKLGESCKDNRECCDGVCCASQGNQCTLFCK